MNPRKNSLVFYLFCLALLLIVLVLPACNLNEENGDNSSSIFDFTSDTDKAVQLIIEANNELKRIKILYNENESKLKELKEAQKDKNPEKVREIANQLVYVINDGFVFADSAKSKIAEAQELNINEQWKEYLSLKESSLDRQIEAFKHLHEAARLLRDTTGTVDKEKIELSRMFFKEKEERFQKMMKDAREISLEADELAKESMKKQN